VFPKTFLLHKVVRDAKKVEKHCSRVYDTRSYGRVLILYSRSGQTCSVYEPHIVNPSYKEPQHKNLKTRIYLQSTLL